MNKKHKISFLFGFPYGRKVRAANPLIKLLIQPFPPFWDILAVFFFSL